MLWDGRRAPFTLLGGYLGAGKTTVVNHVIGHAGGRRLVVIVNDIGAVNVDADLIAEHDGTTMSLTNGCVCCSIADDLGQTLETIREQPEPPDHVVMELSGVAEPARVAPWASTAGFRLDGVVVVADAEQLPEQIERTYVGDTVRAQLGAADLVLISKSDLVSPEAVTALIARHSSAPIVLAPHGVVDPSVVLGVGASPHRDRPAGDDLAATYSTELRAVGTPTLDQLRSIVDGLDAEVLRAKGVIRCTDLDSAVEVHVVGRRRTVRPRRDLPLERAGSELVVIRLASPEVADVVADEWEAEVR